VVVAATISDDKSNARGREAVDRFAAV